MHSGNRLLPAASDLTTAVPGVTAPASASRLPRGPFEHLCDAVVHAAVIYGQGARRTSNMPS